MLYEKIAITSCVLAEYSEPPYRQFPSLQDKIIIDALCA